LPPLDAARVTALFEPVRQPPRRRQVPLDPPADAALLSEALAHIPADDYHTWIQVGMALKHELGDAGFALWDDWSASSPKYDARQMMAKWQSFDPQHITAGTLFHLAGRHGWRHTAPPERGK
jgi:putative DNA primase/helicase